MLGWDGLYMYRGTLARIESSVVELELLLLLIVRVAIRACVEQWMDLRGQGHPHRTISLGWRLVPPQAKQLRDVAVASPTRGDPHSSLYRSLSGPGECLCFFES